MISLGENKLKQPLREMLKKIGGGHLLTEGDDVLQDYWAELVSKIEGTMLSTSVGKFDADVDMNSGGLSWNGQEGDKPDGYEEDYVYIFATPAWEGDKYITFEEGWGSGVKLGKVPLKTTMDKKKDTNWYLATMKKHLPKLVKKLG